MAEQAIVTYGLPRDVNPHTALIELVHASAGHVAYLSVVVSQLERQQLVQGVTSTVILPETVGDDGTTAPGGRRVTIGAAINIYLELYNDERDRLARFCATAIKCGVEAARVELEREQIVRIAGMVRGILDDLGVDLSNPAVGDVIRRRMIGGAAA
jgi:hypothetical protein